MVYMKKEYSVLILILLLAFFLRVYKIGQVPPSLNWDEVSIGYNAYSVLKTGHDEWGQFLPLQFRSFGEFKLPVQIYFSIPAIALFGLNDFGVRITPVLYGTLTVLLTFLLGRKLFKNKFIGLSAAFLLAVSPWHIQLTRGSFEASFADFWICLGVWLFLKGLERYRFLFLSALCFGLSIYTYNSARVFAPLLIAALVFLYPKQLLKNFKLGILLAAFFGMLLVPLVPTFFNGEVSARYKLVSVTNDPGLVLRINENRGLSTLPGPLPRLVHNKVTYISTILVEHYLAHFTPQFLFLNGASHKQHHVQNMGQLYLFEAPFLLYGLWLFLKQKQPFKGVLLSWLLLAFIPVSVTNDSIPHALRTVIVLPVYQLISGLGFYQVVMSLKQKTKSVRLLSLTLLVVTVIISLGFYFYQYYVIYPVNYSRDWQYGYKQVVEYIQEHQNEYDMVVFSRTYGEPHIFTLFYLNYDPNLYQHNPNLNRFMENNWIRVLAFDKYYFPDLGDQGTRYADVLQTHPGKKLLFIGRQQDFPATVKPLKTVNFLNGDSDFVIIDNR